jgi:hypothetical protein
VSRSTFRVERLVSVSGNISFLKKLLYSIGALTGATFLLGSLALAAYITLFPPQYLGWCEVTDGGTGVGGWMINTRAYAERVRVQLYVNNIFIGERVADLPRPDVVSAGFTSDERCGYSFRLPPLAAGKHIARVYAVHETGGGRVRTLQLTGETLEFSIGSASSVEK